MRFRTLGSLGIASCIFLAPFVANAQAAQKDTEIGVTEALNPNATGTPPQAAPRLLEVGVNVVANERIATTEGGQAQMLFVDESAFTIGPNSEVVLDEFVFNPETGVGRLALTATKGVFRFVGGKISKSNPVTLKTPTAVIGIRGGIALVNVQPGGATQATFLFGDQMTVTAAGVTQVATRPGFAITATTADEAPSAPTPAPPAQLNAALNSLERSAPPPQDDGSPGGDQQQGAGGQGAGNQQQAGQQQGGGQNQGRRQVPTDQYVAETNLGAQGSQQAPRALASPIVVAFARRVLAAVGGDSEGPQPGDTLNQAQQNNALRQNLLPSATNLSGRFKRSFSRLTSTAD